MTEKTLKDVLKFWLGEDDLHAETYVHKPQLWFKLNKNTDELIAELFGNLIARAESGELEAAAGIDNPKERVALIIVFDQFSRNVYRGTSDMFKNDARALKLALDLIADPTGSFERLLSPIERYFVYMPLQHSEDLDLVKRSLEAIEKLADQAGALQKPHFLKYLQSARVHYDLLLKYGRYPHRNMLLGRESTSEELEFLQKSKHTFVRSVLPLKSLDASKEESKRDKNKQSMTTTTTDEAASKVKEKNNNNVAPYQRLLFLHGFRQNANKLRKRLGGMLAKLKNACNAQVIFINGTHPYRPNGETATQLESSLGPDLLMPIESQRVWFNSDDDGRVYTGIDESIAYVLTHISINGPYGLFDFFYINI